MLKRVFISCSYSKREGYLEFHNKLKDFLTDKHSFDVYTFVYEFNKKVNEKELMKQAFIKIDESDIVIAELSNKSVGVGIEAGYAKAKGKKIIYIHSFDTEEKETMKGIADIVISYNDIDDLINQISNLVIF